MLPLRSSGGVEKLRWGAANCIPRPPTMSTEGFSDAPLERKGTVSPMIAECCPNFGEDNRAREEMNKGRGDNCLSGLGPPAPEG